MFSPEGYLRRNRVALLPLILAWSASAAGCLSKVEVDPTAIIQCGSNSDCPSGQECRENLGACVDLITADEEAPTLSESSVDPEVAVTGDTLRASFVVSEVLL
ncbi:MAG: hypothetical protein AAF658_20050, partial [Myxococcota bacterium]